MMMNNSLKFLALGSKAAALAVLLGGTALAQGAETVIVPAPALDPGTALGVVTASDLPIIEQLDNNEAVAQTLIAQGFTNIHIRREGALMTVSATRGGAPIELVYSVARGTLVAINGEELRDPPAPASADDITRELPQNQPAEDESGDDAALDEGAGEAAEGDDTGSDDSDSGATDDAEGDVAAGDDGTGEDRNGAGAEGTDMGGGSEGTGSDGGEEGGGEGG